VSAPTPLAHLDVEFVGSFPDPLHPLDPGLPEFALIGRSNVGKSSLLNALTGRRRLARVSSTPGKTQLLNVYRLPTLYLIDLPGYGYARASHGERAGYRTLLERLLRDRPSLAGVIWLLDIRHPPSREDQEFHQMLQRSSVPVLAVLTKADKLNRSGQARALQDRAAELGLEHDQVQAVSAEEGTGIADLATALLARASEEAS
jgi:GTP-binding protein